MKRYENSYVKWCYFCDVTSCTATFCGKKDISICRWCKQSEPEFLNFQAAQESISRNQFDNRYDNPIPNRFLAPQKIV